MPIRIKLSSRKSLNIKSLRIRNAVEALEARTLLSAGDPDSTFGTGGTVLLPAAAGDVNYRVNAVAVQADGKTLLAGSAGTTDNGNLGQFFVERLNVDGTPDAGFGSGGIVTTGFTDLAGANAIVVQSDGKIVVGGIDESALTGISDGDAQFALARYNPDGTPDAGFGAGGKVLTRIPGREQVNALSIAPDGKILAAGLGTFQDPNHSTDANYAASVFMVARYNTNGTLDTGFNTTGYLYRQTDSSALNEAGGPTVAVTAQADGRVIVGSSFKVDAALWRFNVDGTTDTSFGVGGMTWKPLQFADLDDNFNSARVAQIIVQPDGKVLVAGAYDSGGGLTDTWMLARFNVDGTIDTSFGGSKLDGPGIALVNLPLKENSRVAPSGLGLQSDGKILIGGIDNAANGGPIVVQRFSPDGNVDASYHAQNIALGSQTGNAAGGGMAVMPDGRVVVGATVGVNTFQLGVVRLSGEAPPAPAATTPTATNVPVTPGQLNPLFGSQGRTLLNDPGPISTPGSIQRMVNAVAAQADGKVILAGSDGTRDNNGRGNFLLERLNVDGSLDTAFGAGGIVETAFGAISYATSVLIQPDGKIVVGGASADSASTPTNAMFAIARYNADGSPDGTFGTGGKTTTDFTGNEQIDSLALGADGTILAAGSYFSNPNVGFELARYKTNGALDSSLNGTGMLTYNLGAPRANSYPTSVAIQSSGAILVGAHVGGRAAVYRLTPSGTLDLTFADQGIAANPDPNAQAGGVTALAIDSSGRIFAGIADPQAGSSLDFELVRFDSQGHPDSTFNSIGLVTIPRDSTNGGAPAVFPTYDPIAGILPQSDGSVLFVATVPQQDQQNRIGSRLLATRFTATGQTDASWNSTSPNFDPLPNSHGSITGGAVLTPDGKLVVGANVWSNNAANSPHWIGIAEYVTTAATVTVPPPSSGGSNTGGNSGGGGNGGGGNTGGTTSGGTPLPAGQLTAALLGAIPGSIVGMSKGKISIRIVNSAKTQFTGPVSVALYASADGALSNDDTLIQTLTIPSLKLAGGRSKVVKLNFTYPASLSSGSYTLLAAVTETNDGTAPAVAASAKAMTIKAATVDLSSAFASGNTFKAKLGGKAKAVLILKNVGTVTANGSAQITLYASANQAVDNSDTILSGPLTKTLKIKPGKSVRVNVSFTVPGSSFNYLLAQIVATTQPADVSAGNDVATAAFSA